MGRKSAFATGAIRRLCAFAGMALAALMFANVARAGDTITVGTEILLVEPLGLTKARDMDFGNVIPETGGTIDMVPTATPTCSTGGTVIHSGECQPAVFAGSGSVGQRVRIRVPVRAEIEIANAAGDTMLITDVTLDAQPDLVLVQQSTRNWRFDIVHPSGIFLFRVGGVLNVGANQPEGTYSGEFDIDIQYF